MRIMNENGEKITLYLDQANYRLVIRQYGPEAAKDTAIRMCIAAGLPITEANLYSQLSILENDMTEMFG
jgi:hypothetical protein